MAIRRKVIAGAAAALAVGGTGAGIAATKLVNQSPAAESKAVVNDAAKSLGIEPTKLSAALKKAMEDRVDAAVAAGRLTKAQGDELKQRIAADDFPLFGGPGFGPRRGGPHELSHGLGAAAAYLGLTPAQLQSRVSSGKTLAEIAKAQGKTVDGLKAALRKDEQQELDAAVKAGRLTKADEQRVLKDLDQRLDALVNGTLRERFRDHRDFRGGFDRQAPPPTLPAA
ncbi:MAG: hypothetical protein QOG06_1965 [Gaiellaceae bacterium]|jgi:signal transduction protein with GAF and PtsI domain|nr:hypothetical protein [Gaiellaceae bacterium]